MDTQIRSVELPKNCWFVIAEQCSDKKTLLDLRLVNKIVNKAVTPVVAKHFMYMDLVVRKNTIQEKTATIFTGRFWSYCWITQQAFLTGSYYASQTNYQKFQDILTQKRKYQKLEKDFFDIPSTGQHECIFELFGNKKKYYALPILRDIDNIENIKLETITAPIVRGKTKDGIQFFAVRTQDLKDNAIKIQVYAETVILHAWSGFVSDLNENRKESIYNTENQTIAFDFYGFQRREYIPSGYTALNQLISKGQTIAERLI